MPKSRRPRERGRANKKHQTISNVDLNIAVATGPGAGKQLTSALGNDIQLLKPALLYADHVTLHSPVAQMVTHVAKMETFTSEEKLDFLIATMPLVEPEKAERTIAWIRENRPAANNRGRLTRQDLINYGTLLQWMNRFWEEEFIPSVVDIVSQTGMDQLMEPVKRGLVELKPVGPIQHQMFFDRSAEATYSEAMINAYAKKIYSLIDQPGVYPLFDSQMSNIAWHAINEGVVTVTPTTTNRAKQVAAASRFLHYLPTFHLATLDEIMDIREELRPPLVQFRQAMIRYAHPIETSPYGKEFSEQADEVFMKEIAPALENFRLAVETNSTLSALIGMPKMAAWGSVSAPVLVFGLTGMSHIYEAVAATLPSALPVAQALMNKRKRDREMQNNELYFLYKTDRLLR